MRGNYKVSHFRRTNMGVQWLDRLDLSFPWSCVQFTIDTLYYSIILQLIYNKLVLIEILWVFNFTFLTFNILYMYSGLQNGVLHGGDLSQLDSKSRRLHPFPVSQNKQILCVYCPFKRGTVSPQALSLSSFIRGWIRLLSSLYMRKLSARGRCPLIRGSAEGMDCCTYTNYNIKLTLDAILKHVVLDSYIDMNILNII